VPGALLGTAYSSAGVLPGRLFDAGALPGRLFIEGVLCVGIFCCVAAALIRAVSTGALPVRPELKLGRFDECARAFASPCAGVLRITGAV